MVDDKGRELKFRQLPERIVSLVPSDSYTLARLGAGSRLVGRTRYCELPAEEVSGAAVVGGTKDADVTAILELKPDLVLVNQEENTLSAAETLRREGVPIFVSFPTKASHSLIQVSRLARLLGDLTKEGKDLVRFAYAADAELQAGWNAKRVRVFVPIWMEPLMTIHRDTFISDQLFQLGADNVFADRVRHYPLAADLGNRKPQAPGDRDVRYPRVRLEEVVERQPDLVLLPDEPHPFTEEDARCFRELAIPAAPDRVRFCIGKQLMWPGLMALEGAQHLRSMIHGPAN